jgi:hypothetical protein
MMQRGLTLGALLALVLVFLIGPTLAQDDLPPLDQSYTSPELGYSFNYPSGWLLDASTRDIGNGRQIMLAFAASNQSAAQKMGQGSAVSLDTGETIIGVTVGPLGTVYNAPADATATELLDVVTRLSGQTYDPIRELSIGGFPAAITTRTDERFQELNIITAYGDGLFGFFVLFTAPDQLAYWTPVVRDMARSMNVGMSAPAPAATLNAVTVSLTERYVYEDNSLRFAYPPGWDVAASLVPDTGSQRLILGYAASAPAVSRKMGRGVEATLAPNEVGITFLTGNVPAAYGLTSDVSAAQIAQAVAERNNYRDFQVSGTIIAGRPAARVSRSYPGHDALDLVVEHSGDTFSLITLYTPPGQLRQWEPVGLAFASLLTYTPPNQAAAVPLRESIRSTSGQLSLRFPSGWQSRRAGDNAIYIANNANALNYRFGDRVNDREIQLLASATPRAGLLNRLGLDANASLSTILERVTANAQGSGSVTYGVTTSATYNGMPAVSISFEGDGFSGVAGLIEVNSDTLVAMQYIASQSEGPLWMPVYQAMAAALSYTP